MKKRFGFLEESNSSKQDSSSKQVFSNMQGRSNREDVSNKQVRTRKQVSTRKQDRSSNQDDSNKQDISNKDITDVDPDLLCDKLRETLSKSVMLESDYTMIKMIIDELLRVKAITKRQHNTICKKCDLKNFLSNNYITSFLY